MPWRKLTCTSTLRWCQWAEQLWGHLRAHSWSLQRSDNQPWSCLVGWPAGKSFVVSSGKIPDSNHMSIDRVKFTSGKLVTRCKVMWTQISPSLHARARARTVFDKTQTLMCLSSSRPSREIFAANACTQHACTQHAAADRKLDPRFWSLGNPYQWWRHQLIQKMASDFQATEEEESSLHRRNTNSSGLESFVVSWTEIASCHHGREHMSA